MLKSRDHPSSVWQFAKHGIWENLAPQSWEHLHQYKSGKQSPWQQQAQLWVPTPSLSFLPGSAFFSLFVWLEGEKNVRLEMYYKKRKDL